MEEAFRFDASDDERRKAVIATEALPAGFRHEERVYEETQHGRMKCAAIRKVQHSGGRGEEVDEIHAQEYCSHQTDASHS